MSKNKNKPVFTPFTPGADKIDPIELNGEKEVMGKIVLPKPIIDDDPEPFATDGKVAMSPIVEEEISDDATPFVSEVVSKNSGPGARQLMEETVEPAKPGPGACPRCGHKSTDAVGTQIRCANCSSTVTLK